MTLLDVIDLDEILIVNSMWENVFEPWAKFVKIGWLVSKKASTPQAKTLFEKKRV